MAAMKFSKSHEREEARRLRKGFVHSWIGLLFCWLPAGGLIFAISGFVRVIVRLTRRHRARRRAYLVFSFLSLALCVGALMGEMWLYSRDPGIVDRMRAGVWTFLTGQAADPVATPEPGVGTAYTDMDTAGLGVLGGAGGLQEESDGLTEGDLTDEDWLAWDENFDWSEWENSEEWTDAGGTPLDGADLNDPAFWGEEDGGAAGESLSEEEGLDWLDEGDGAIVWLDENGEEIPPETFLRVGPGETIAPPKE